MVKKQLFWLNLLLVLILNFIRIIISISTFYSKMDILKIIVHRSISQMKTNIFFKEMYQSLLYSFEKIDN